MSQLCKKLNQVIMTIKGTMVSPALSIIIVKLDVINNVCPGVEF